MAPFCVLGRGVRLGRGVILASHAVVEEGAVLEDGVCLGAHTVVHAGTRVGPGCQVGDHSILGKLPSVAATSTLKKRGDLTGQPLPPLVLGPRCTVGALAVIYAGTEIGEECFVADLASIREHCRLGRQVIVGRGVTVENHVTIGEGTKLQAEAYITALSTLEEQVFIAPTVSTSNDNYMARTEERFRHRKGATIRRGARVGANAVLLPGVEVGQEAVVGAGSVVTRNVPPYRVAFGNPARDVRPTPPEQILFPPEDGCGVR